MGAVALDGRDFETRRRYAGTNGLLTRMAKPILHEILRRVYFGSFPGCSDMGSSASVRAAGPSTSVMSVHFVNTLLR